MQYLKEFGLTEEELQEILDQLTDDDWVYITSSRTYVKKILSYLTSIGITNIKDILMYRPSVLYEKFSDIKKNLEESSISNIVQH